MRFNRLLTAVVAGTLLSGCFGNMTVNELRAAYHTANAVDVGTTIYGLDNGFHEGNPMFPGLTKEGALGVGLASSLLAEVVCSHAGKEEKICWQMFASVKMVTGGWNLFQIATK